MRKYSVEDKLRMIKLILDDKHSTRSVAAAEGIHPSTLESWIRNYQISGLEAFQRKGRVKRTSAEKKQRYWITFQVMVRCVISAKSTKFLKLILSDSGL